LLLRRPIDLRLIELRSSFDDALIARCRSDGVRAAAPSPPSIAPPAVGVTAAEDMQDPRAVLPCSSGGCYGRAGRPCS